MRFSLGETTKEFRRRNLATGVSTSEARRQEAGYAQALQRMQSTGMQDTARIREEGAMNRIMAAQEFDQPLREEQTEGARLANVGTRFANVMGKKYGERAIREKFDMAPIVPRANVFFPERTSLNELQPKSDISDIATPSTTAAGKAAPGGFLQGWSRAWDRSSKTPVGRSLGLPAINYLTQKGFEGLDVAGKGMENIFRRAFTPIEDTPALPLSTSTPSVATSFSRPVPKKKKFKWRDNY